MRSKIFYHGTAAKNLPAILKAGLLPHAGIGADHWAADNHPGLARQAKRIMESEPERRQAVFMSGRLEVAVWFAAMAAEANNSEPCVLSIAVPAEASAAVTVDNDSTDSNDENPMEAYEFVGKIPPAWIKPLPKAKIKNVHVAPLPGRGF